MDNPEAINTTDNLHEVVISDESTPESVTAKNFKDVASAAQEAFQFAAYAALAAKAAIELSRSESQDIDTDHEDASQLQKSEKILDLNSSHEPKLNIEEASIPSSKIDHSDDFSFEKFRPVELESSSSECEDEDIAESNQEESPEEPVKESISSVPNLDSDTNSIFHNEPENGKLVSKGDEVASKNESSNEDIRVHESK